MLVTIPFFAIAIALIMGFAPVRAGCGGVSLTLGILLSVLLALTFWKEQNSVGIDTLVWTGLWVFVLVPALVALMVGAVLGQLAARPKLAAC